MNIAISSPEGKAALRPSPRGDLRPASALPIDEPLRAPKRQIPRDGGRQIGVIVLGLVIVTSIPKSRSGHLATVSASRFGGGAFYRLPPAARLWCAAPMLGLLGGCDGAPSRNILGSYFPSWMVCALVGIALALAARAIFKALGMLEELPVPLVVMLAIGCAGTFAMWLIWLA